MPARSCGSHARYRETDMTRVLVMVPRRKDDRQAHREGRQGGVRRAAASVDELWQAAGRLERRDLLYGAGGNERFPTQTTFTFVARDTTGWSPGLDVRDDAGVEWSVKLGPESQSEVVASRVLWAIGFHQPPTYYLELPMTGAEGGAQPPGDFAHPARARSAATGRGTRIRSSARPFGGLVVVNLILNSWDWKTSNNKITTARAGKRRPPMVHRARRQRVPRQDDVSNHPEVVSLRGFGQYAQRPAGLRGAGLHRPRRDRRAAEVRLSRYLR